MIVVISHSQGVNYKNGDRIIHRKWFRKIGIAFYLYYISRLFLEDYIDVIYYGEDDE